MTTKFEYQKLYWNVKALHSNKLLRNMAQWQNPANPARNKTDTSMYVSKANLKTYRNSIGKVVHHNNKIMLKV